MTPTEKALELMEAGLTPQKAARTLLVAYKVGEHANRALDTDEVYGAFYGGRKAILRQGRFEDCWRYDIRCAYPSVMAWLPSLKHAYWRDAIVWRPGDWVISRVGWGETSVPLPYREADGSVSYPPAGVSWQWVAGQEGVLDGIGWRLEGINDDSFPFLWMRKVMSDLRLHDEGTASWLKQMLRCCWGSLLLRGFEGESVLWAGIVAAAVESRVIKALKRCGEDAIMVNVDSVVTRKRWDFHRPGGPGYWVEKGPMTITVEPGTFGPGIGHPDPERPGVWCPWWPTEEFRNVSIVGGRYEQSKRWDETLPSYQKLDEAGVRRLEEEDIRAWEGTEGAAWHGGV